MFHQVLVRTGGASLQRVAATDLPFCIPASAVLSDDKEIRRVEGANAPVVVPALIRQFDPTWLVVVGKHIGVVLHFMHGGKFKPMTFKLNTDAHFLAGVATTHIACRALDTARRRRCPNVSNERFRLFWKGQTLTPVFKGFITEHAMYRLSLRHGGFYDRL